MDIHTAIVIGILAACAISAIVTFAKLPNATKVANVKEWLKWAVVEAEKQMGSGTGQLKLRLVYDMAVKQFPWVVQLITFELFSLWVDEALEWMKTQLSDNKATQEYVESK